MIINKEEVILDGQALTAIHPDILIQEISYQAAEKGISTSSVAGRSGESVGRATWKQARVTVTIRVLIRDLAKRQSVIQQIDAWAEGKTLQISSRPGQEMDVVCMVLPSVGDLSKWTGEIKIEFRGYNPPFWREKTASILSLSGTTGSGTLYLPGNAGEALVEVTAKPKSTITSLTLTVGDTSISLTGISATASAPITISYDDNRRISILQGSVSIFSRRTGASSDDLLAESGKRTEVSFTASAAADVTFKARGLWR